MGKARRTTTEVSIKQLGGEKQINKKEDADPPFLSAYLPLPIIPQRERLRKKKWH
jgi:hypothetical protein